jgi:hypothetical protein
MAFVPDDPVLTSLLYEEEGPSLDFKREQYRFVGGTDTEKAELLKDILAFVNAWRRSEAFIMIGVEERQGSKAEVVGVDNHLRDADLQQFVNSKTNAPVDISYSQAELEGKSVGVVRIPLQDKPRFLLRPFGTLQADCVFIRRGSSTVVAKPDEVARMGAAVVAAAHPAPRLEVRFADVQNRQLKSDCLAVNGICLDLGDIEKLPDYVESSKGPWGMDYLRGEINHHYYRELAWYTLTRKLCSPAQIAIVNNGSSLAQDVRVELGVSEPKALLLDDDSWPDVPRASSDLLSLSLRNNIQLKNNNIGDYVRCKRLDDRWIVEIRATKVQPKSIAWVPGFLYVGRAESGGVVLDGTVSADNLPAPQAVKLIVDCTIERRTATLQDVLALERARYLALKKSLPQRE